MQNNFYLKTENTDNARRVKQFYLEVLKEFSERLEKQMRYKPRFIRSDQIQQLQKRVRYKLECPTYLFDRFLSMKEGATKVEHQSKNQQQVEIKNTEVKEEYDQANNDYRVPSQNRIRQKDEQSDGDDLEDYEDAIQNGVGPVAAFKPAKSEVEVKKEQNFEAYKSKIHDSKEIKQQQNESDDSDEELTIQQCEQSLNSVMLSTFNTSTLKHKPKQQKITINLDNTFLKSIYNEFYIGQVNVDINKVEKADVQKQYSFALPEDKKRGR